MYIGELSRVLQPVMSNIQQHHFKVSSHHMKYAARASSLS